MNEKLLEWEKKSKLINEESKKKDEKMRELAAEVLEKGKAVNEREKAIADLQAKQGFDHHIIEEKDKMIEKLQEERKNMKTQAEVDKAEKTEKAERLEKGEREKMKREIDKLKKDYDQLKKSIEAVEKERD